jgi:hypothetical protein
MCDELGWWEYLARIEYSGWVERVFDRAHQRNTFGSVF